MDTHDPIRLPITRVLVLEDRAQVERSGSVALASGRHTLEIGDLSRVVVDRSIEVEAHGGRVLDAKVVRRWRERGPDGLHVDASELRRKLDALEREALEHRDRIVRARTRREALTVVRGDVLRAIAEGAGAGIADAAGWQRDLDDVTERQGAAEEAVRVAGRAGRDCRERIAETRRALAIAEQAEPDLASTLVIDLAVEGPVELRVRYQVPCACWRPAYRAQLTGDAVELASEAVVWQRTGEDWSAVELAFSTARPTLGTSPPTLVEDRVRSRPKQAVEKKVVDVAIREVEIAKTGDGASVGLPGLDDGGETRLLRAPARASIPGDGQPHRVPLASFSAPVQRECVCPAELAEQGILVARFPNRGSEPLLAGPVDLLRDSGYVGRSSIDFTAVGETVVLSFGSEDGVVVLRDVQVARDTTRLSGRQIHKTTVTLHVSNASATARTLIVEERIPVSEVKDVEIELLQRECSPAPREVTRDGIVRIELALGANATRTATLVWELSAAGKVAGL